MKRLAILIIILTVTASVFGANGRARWSQSSGSGSGHDAVTVTDSSSVDLTLSTQNITADANETYLATILQRADANLTAIDQDLSTSGDPNFTAMTLNAGSTSAVGNLKIYDQDAAEYLNIDVSNGTGYFSMLGTTPGAMNFQWDANASIVNFYNAAEGETPAVNTYGFKTGDQKRVFSYQISSDVNDAVLFDGVSYYYVDGTMLATAFSGNGASLTSLDGENISDDTIDDDSIDFSDVTLADFTDDVGIGTATSITDDLIVMADLNQDSEPDDADILTYDSTGGNFEWITPNAGTDITADLEEETHASEHLVGGADSVFPVDPGADAFLQWDDTNSVSAWTALADLFISAGTDPDLSVSGEVSIDTDGANEPNDVVLRTTDTGGDTQYALASANKVFHVYVNSPDNLEDPDTIVVLPNHTGMSFVVTKWVAYSDIDNDSLNLEEITDATNFSAARTTVDAVEITTDGTGVYYASDTTITHATIETGHILVIDYDQTDDAGWFDIYISGYFIADVD